MPITSSGTVGSSNSLTLTDSDNNLSTSVLQSVTYSTTSRPANGPPASPTSSDLTQIYGNLIFRKSYTGITSSTGNVVTMANLPDLFCNTNNCTKINTITVKNNGNQPLNIIFDDITGATGDIIKVPAYGNLQVAAPMDGISVSAANITLKCATANSTTDAQVAITFQKA